MWKTLASIGLKILGMVIDKNSNNLAMKKAFSGLVDAMEKESLASVKLRDDYQSQLKALEKFKEPKNDKKKDPELH